MRHYCGSKMPKACISTTSPPCKRGRCTGHSSSLPPGLHNNLKSQSAPGRHRSSPVLTLFQKQIPEAPDNQQPVFLNLMEVSRRPMIARRSEDWVAGLRCGGIPSFLLCSGFKRHCGNPEIESFNQTTPYKGVVWLVGFTAQSFVGKPQAFVVCLMQCTRTAHSLLLSWLLSSYTCARLL